MITEEQAREALEEYWRLHRDARLGMTVSIRDRMNQLGRFLVDFAAQVLAEREEKRTRQKTHSAQCWRDHHECAVARLEGVREMAEKWERRPAIEGVYFAYVNAGERILSIIDGEAP